MTIKKLLQKKYLNAFPPLDTELLLAFVIRKPREYVLTHPEYNLSLWQTLRFFYAFRQLKQGIPVAYILHRKEFFGLDFYVDQRVLIPRPDTEVLVESVLARMSTINTPATLIDIGTGTGCIPISIAKQTKNKDIKIIATDVSRCALRVARKNARTHNVSMDFLHGNLLEPLLSLRGVPKGRHSNLHQNSRIASSLVSLIPRNDKLIITANLPYGWSAWKNNSSVASPALKHEPALALFTGEHGLQLYRELLEQLASLGHPFTAFFEFDPRQTAELTALIQQHLPTAQIEIKKDLAQRDRVAIITT